MKLSDHVEHLRSLIYKSFSNQFSRLGFGEKKLFDIDKIPTEYHSKRQKIENLIDSHTDETGSYVKAREKALDELSFTLFNRLAAIKVMEAHQLFPPIVTKEAEHGDRSFGHKMWLEQNPNMRQEELEGLREYFKYEFNKLGASIPLFHKDYPYALLPYVIELNEIIDAFNAVEEDNQVEEDIWQSDDVLGWLYESYNNVKKQEHKDSKAKTEYHKVSLQSQVYTPRWVVEFLVENSLGKMYLEMYPHSDIKNQFKIANAPEKRIREPKPLHEIKLIDPASGSGNFLLYAFEFFYKLYEDQIDNYGADYDEDDIAQLIIENNLHGIDLDDRAIQLAQLGLWIKAKQKRRSIGKLNFNVVSSDFFLPDFDFVYPIFKEDIRDSKEMETIETIWNDLQNAHKFGSLVRLNEKVDAHISALRNSGAQLFSEQEEKQSAQFKATFLSNLEKAFLRYATQQGNSFLTDKTKDAITFLRLITQKYDVATANPPYTDSGDFGPELKKFVEANYKKPYKFHTNLYATFIKRCFELTNKEGKLAMIHPLTFMFIKTFEDVRKFMLEKSRINLFVHHGPDTKSIFDGAFASAPAYYVLEKKIFSSDNSLFISVDQYTRTPKEKLKREFVLKAIDDFSRGISNQHNYVLLQSKLKAIKSFPFIYWISDKFREKFLNPSLDDVLDAKVGINSGGNNKYLRFWWEICPNDFFKDIDPKNNKWVPYAKGGPYKKWAGNMWLALNWENNGATLKNDKKSILRNSDKFFQKGITYTFSGASPSFRILPPNSIFDVSGSSIFLNEYDNLYYSLAYLNSKIASYILGCLNPTVSTQIGDLKRVPFVIPEKSLEVEIENLSKINEEIELSINSFKINDPDYKNGVFKSKSNYILANSYKEFLNWENKLKIISILNEAKINNLIYKIFDLSENDKSLVSGKEGQCIGALPVSKEAKQAYLDNEVEEFPLDHIRDYIQSLPEKEFTSAEREVIESEFPQLYQSNNDLEEFCIRHQINPINVWYWFKEDNVIPKQRMNDLAMEFLADLLREILMEDEDGIIPLVPNAGEKILLDRIEQKFIEKGFTMAQYSSFDSVLGRELNDYLNNHFFKAFSDHLNLFMYLPKTPFIWHLSSGPEQGFDCYIIIYKWNRDKLLSIRSRYLEQRERALENRQTDLNNKSVLSASEQNELEKIYKQLKEIESFKQKIDELLAEGYDPILDDGVGKNIAPLQKKKMIPYDVLTAGQLKIYLNADW
ncbi:BREX-1 system adenine-specific DNA-methyltransferase PglX [Weeksellaceae bacterium KMM 9713]|uniref:site-specific DNA-methyltransferase (adenine-specific) n=1 Tax=Profundicola chukchiensis TaxID=2961959 RepID=A0A9X4N2N4_9FLAO|nr:BREX-1 system adenine-specific DNA-methyltransferase PglX [Profundicola chukchiensis]MDG4945714.1 BREX-1 system adenine-specific DNA-methyltransferase PglX [Profundicola chukchiensis]